jgi:hypothetical protein
MNARRCPSPPRAPDRGAGARVRARGSAALLLTGLLLLLAAAALARVGRDVEARRIRQADRQLQMLAGGRDRVLQWLDLRLADFDATWGVPSGVPTGSASFPVADPQAILEQSGVDVRSGVRLAVGPAQMDAGVPFHPMALWLPAGRGDAPALGANGAYLPGADPSRTLPFSTRGLEQAARARSLATLERLARSAEARFATKTELDPDHRADRNWFRAPDGICRSRTDQFPCAATLATDSWPLVQQLRANSTAFDGSSEEGAELDRNGWGLPNFWSNDADPNFDQRPPYSMAFSTTTPWGERLTVRAVQPL